MQAVLLDLDGTLIDSRRGIEASLNAALIALGHAPDPTRDLTFALGPPLPEVMRDLLAPYGDVRVGAAVEAYRAEYGARGLFAATAYPRIETALDVLRRDGVRLFVATSKRADFAHRVLDHLGLSRAFDGVYGTEPGGALDDKAALIAHLLAAEHVSPAAATMIGDRRHDIHGAHANGVRACGVLWGYGTLAELETAGADALVSAPGDLPATVERVRLRALTTR